MEGLKICFMGKCGKLSLNYPFYPLLSEALDCVGSKTLVFKLNKYDIIILIKHGKKHLLTVVNCSLFIISIP